MRSEPRDLPEGWARHDIADICEIFDGPHATPKRIADGPVFLGIASLDQGRLDVSKSDHVSEEDFARWTRRVTPRPGDVVFSYETRLGEAAIIPDGLRCCLGRRMGLLRPLPESEVDPAMLLYAYLGPQFQAEIRQNTIHGSTVDRIPLNRMGTFQIALPPAAEQRRIAWVLGALDRQSATERTLASTCRELASVLFRKEFVLGATSEWREATLVDLARFVNGRNFTKASTGTGRPVIRIKELRSGLSPATVWNDVEAKPDNVAGPDDLLFSWSGTLCVERWPGPEGLVNQHLFKVVPENDWPGWFVEGWLRHHLSRFQHIAAAKATTMGHIQRGDLSSSIVMLPDPEVISRLDPAMTALSERAASAVQRARSADDLRAALLPKLVSGEIRVPDTAEIREAIEATVEDLSENGSVPPTVTVAAA